VTHRVCTHRLVTRKMQPDAPRHPHPVCRAIRRIRAEQKINQEEAAERCGLHRTYYSGIERGVRNVSLVNIEKVARGLKKSLPELFGRV
jgi:transcriptional regulator with XRE-family HTH domain